MKPMFNEGLQLHITFQPVTPTTSLDTDHGLITFHPLWQVPSFIVDRYLRMLTMELDKYTAAGSYLGIDKITLVHRLSFNGSPWCAVPHFGGKTLYVDVGCGAHDTQYQAGIVHHEVFHFVEWMAASSGYHTAAMLQLERQWEQEWGGEYHFQLTSLANAVSTSFLVGHEHEHDKLQEIQGFVSSYARTNAVEDRAEVFRYIMTTPIQATCKEIVEHKVQLLKRFLCQIGVWKNV
jgi:hypothetical protein